MFKVLIVMVLLSSGTAFAGDAGLNAPKSVAPPKSPKSLPGKIAKNKAKAQEKATPGKEVVWIDAARSLVWINLGQADGVGRGAKFQVGKKQDDEIVTGQIEVTRILAPHLAEARIISQEANESLGKGDPILP